MEEDDIVLLGVIEDRSHCILAACLEADLNAEWNKVHEYLILTHVRRTQALSEDV